MSIYWYHSVQWMSYVYMIVFNISKNRNKDKSVLTKRTYFDGNIYCIFSWEVLHTSYLKMVFNFPYVKTLVTHNGDKE